jgi:uncharacterized protein (DUF1800 family)
MNRRDFITASIRKAVAQAADGNRDGRLPEEMYQNQSLPTDLELSSAGLSDYNGQWTRTQATQLLRRACFGFNRQTLDSVSGMTMNDAVDMLLNVDNTPPPPPLNNYNTSQNTDPNVPLGQTWVNAAPSADFNFLRAQSLRSWWMGQMLADTTLREKMTLFWHNHFATQLSIYNDAHYGYKHLAMLRANALGNFKTMVKEVTIDPAMLSYLNGNSNTKTAPDENYGRELQELFTVGKGPDSHYTEADVKAAAKVLTGWRNSRTSVASYFDPTRHDINNKQFSAFYNNTVITGKSGAAGADETDELIDMIFAQNEVARFICRKLYKFFVYYVIDADVETNVIIPLADEFIANNFEIKPVLAKLFKSDHFYDTYNYGCVIKPPTDLTIGLMRQFNVTVPAPDVPTQYQFWNYIWAVNTLLQQSPLDTPNVAGWPAYYQEPQYHELWINSDTLPKRNQITDLMVYVGYKRNGQTLIIDPVAFADQFSDAADPNLLIEDTLEVLYAVEISQTQKDILKSALLSGQTSDHYWSDIWNQYKNNPGDTNNLNMVKTRLQTMLKYLMNLAEYQLS